MSGPAEAREAAENATLDEWSNRVAERISGKVDDARAHAGRAVTEALRQTPDGRPTLRRAGRSRSAQAAMARLDELHADLCGKSTSSLDGMLRDAREAFYRVAWHGWRPEVPEEYLRPYAGSAPSPAAIAAARGTVLHGLELRHEMEGPIRLASRELGAAIVVAGRRGSDRRAGDDRLDAWARRARERITRAAVFALGDAMIALDRQAGRDLVRPEFLDDRLIGGPP